MNDSVFRIIHFIVGIFEKVMRAGVEKHIFFCKALLVFWRRVSPSQLLARAFFLFHSFSHLYKSFAFLDAHNFGLGNFQHQTADQLHVCATGSVEAPYNFLWIYTKFSAQFNVTFQDSRDISFCAWTRSVTDCDATGPLPTLHDGAFYYQHSGKNLRKRRGKH